MRKLEREPSHRELRAIEAAWPVIAAELAVVDAEVAAARSGDEQSELGRRRLRRALPVKPSPTDLVFASQAAEALP